MKYRTIEITAAHCLNCDHPFYGREDKKFCSQECKNHYNNSLRRQKTQKKQSTISALDKNYELLESLSNADIKSARLIELDALGFKKNYCTFNILINRQRLFRCYDIEYQLSDTKVYNIKKI